jgi:hypothetical protein
MHLKVLCPCWLCFAGFTSKRIVTWWSGTIAWFPIDDRIYWTPWYSACPHFIVYYCTHTSVHIHVFTSRFSVPASNGGRSPSSGLPNYLRPQLQQLSGSESESELLYDWPFTANQFVLQTSPTRLTTSNFYFRLNTCGYSPYVKSSLMGGWVCRLKLLLALASAVIIITTFYCLRFESSSTWRARSSYLYPPGRGWPNYTHRHWFSVYWLSFL